MLPRTRRSLQSLTNPDKYSRADFSDAFSRMERLRSTSGNCIAETISSTSLKNCLIALASVGKSLVSSSIILGNGSERGISRSNALIRYWIFESLRSPPSNSTQGIFNKRRSAETKRTHGKGESLPLIHISRATGMRISIQD